MRAFVLLFGALCMLALPSCAAREKLGDFSGRNVKMIFHLQAKKRSVMKVAPLTASEALLILENYEAGQSSRRGRRGNTRARGSSSRPKATGPMTRLKRLD